MHGRSELEGWEPKPKMRQIFAKGKSQKVQQEQGRRKRRVSGTVQSEKGIVQMQGREKGENQKEQQNENFRLQKGQGKGFLREKRQVRRLLQKALSEQVRQHGRVLRKQRTNHPGSIEREGRNLIRELLLIQTKQVFEVPKKKKKKNTMNEKKKMVYRNTTTYVLLLSQRTTEKRERFL